MLIRYVGMKLRSQNEWLSRRSVELACICMKYRSPLFHCSGTWLFALACKDCQGGHAEVCWPWMGNRTPVQRTIQKIFNLLSRCLPQQFGGSAHPCPLVQLWGCLGWGSLDHPPPWSAESLCTQSCRVDWIIPTHCFRFCGVCKGGSGDRGAAHLTTWTSLLQRDAMVGR